MTLKQMREAAGFSQKKIAELTGAKSQGSVSQWETGECGPGLNKIPILANLYNVTEGEIIQAFREAKEAG